MTAQNQPPHSTKPGAGPGTEPKPKLPAATPLNTRSPKMSPQEDAPGSGNSGEDPRVESGLPEHDPERPSPAGGDEPME